MRPDLPPRVVCSPRLRRIDKNHRKGLVRFSVSSDECAGGRGGFEVENLSWTNGQLAGARIVSKLGNACRLRSKWPIEVREGTNVVSAPVVQPGLYQFATGAGGRYTIVPRKE